MNPDKFQAIVLDKQRSNYTGTTLAVSSTEIHFVSSVDVLAVKVDDKFLLFLQSL